METTSASAPASPLFQLVKLHAKGGGDNGKITEHAAAHQRNTAKKRDVGKPFLPPVSSPPSQASSRPAAMAIAEL